MSKSKILLGTLAVVLAALPCLADTNIPDLELSEATIAYGGPGIASLLVVPDGSGPTFTQARDEDGNEVDATITLYLRDPLGVPFVHYPHEDLWLETADDGLVACGYGLVADQNTDANGMTYWVDPQPAGGYSEDPVLVYVNGSPLTSNAGLPLQFNSPDINGDLVVGLEDIGFLASDYFVGYQYRSDFHRDGVINLVDIVIMAQKLGASCP